LINIKINGLYCSKINFLWNVKQRNHQAKTLGVTAETNKPTELRTVTQQGFSTPRASNNNGHP